MTRIWNWMNEPVEVPRALAWVVGAVLILGAIRSLLEGLLWLLQHVHVHG